MKEIGGIIVPILTPMDKDESVNLDALRVQIDRMIEAASLPPFRIASGEMHRHFHGAAEGLALLVACTQQALPAGRAKVMELLLPCVGRIMAEAVPFAAAIALRRDHLLDLGEPGG